jgi:hypothetical protein
MYNNTEVYTLWTLYSSYFKGDSANIQLQVCSVNSLEYKLLLLLVNKVEKRKVIKCTLHFIAFDKRHTHFSQRSRV